MVCKVSYTSLSSSRGDNNAPTASEGRVKNTSPIERTDKMSVFTNKVLPALSGKQEAVVKSYREVSNDKGGYLEVIFKLQDRDYTLNVFPGHGATEGRQVNYIVGAIRKQLGRSNESLSLVEVLELAKKTPINIWFSYSQEYERMNVNFHEPVQLGSVNVDEIPA